MPAMPPSRPMPLILKPPNGEVVLVDPVVVDPHRAGADAVGHRAAPGAATSSTRRRRGRTAMSLAMRTASSSSSKRITDSTGPNTSSCAMRMRLSTSTKIGRLEEQPLRPPGHRRRLAAGDEPRALGLGDLDVRLDLLELRPRRDRRDLRGRVGRVAEAHVRDEREQLARRTRRGSLSCTSSREPATQIWPDAAKMPATTPFTAWSRSASSKTMLGDLPPSSIVTRFMCRAAFSLIVRPASGPPVKAMRSTRGWLDQRVADLRAVAGDDVDHAGREARRPRPA